MVEVRTGSAGQASVHEPVTGDNAAPTECKPLRVDAQRNHQKILEAAEEIFALDGVSVPIDLVAERAGVGIGTLYRHFPTKESLYEAIVLTRLTDLADTAEEYARVPDAGAAFEGFLRELSVQAAQKQDLFEALGQAGIDVKARCSDKVDELVRRVDVLRRRAVDAGALRDDVETAEILNLMMGTCNAASHNRTDLPGIQRLVNIVIAGLRPSSAT
jgi:AcrR family transcriptional regulator